MTMNQQQKDALSQNWEAASEQIRSQFPDVTDADLAKAQAAPDQLANTLATSSGQDREQVEQALQQIAQGFQGGSPGSQGQSGAQGTMQTDQGQTKPQR